MPTRFTVVHTGHYLGTAQIARIFAHVMAPVTPYEQLEPQAYGVVSFLAYKMPLQVNILRLHKLITDRDPLAELRIDGRPYSPFSY